MNRTKKKRGISYILIIALLASLCTGLIPIQSSANDNSTDTTVSQAAITDGTVTDKENEEAESSSLEMGSKRNEKTDIIGSLGKNITSKMNLTSLDLKHNGNTKYSKSDENGVSFKDDESLFSFEKDGTNSIEFDLLFNGNDEALDYKKGDYFIFDLGDMEGEDKIVSQVDPYGFDLHDKDTGSKAGEGLFQLIKKTSSLYEMNLKVVFDPDKSLDMDNVKVKGSIDGSVSAKEPAPAENKQPFMQPRTASANNAQQANSIETESTLQTKISSAPDGTETTIQLNNDINLTKTLSIPANKNIKLSGKFSLKRASNFSDSMITNNGTLTIDGITIDGANISSGANSGILNKKTLILNSGIIQNCIGKEEEKSQGGGIDNSGTSATFTMNGGTIKNNKGEAGGIRLSGASKMIMNGGIIEKNKGYWGGGICAVSKNDNLTIYAGIIRDNETDYLGGGIYTHYYSIFNAYNVLLKNNNSGQGGGLWVCEEGNGKVSKTNGLACFDNTGKFSGDDFYKKNGGSSSRIDLSTSMIGGGTTKWYKDGPSENDRYKPSNSEYTALTGIQSITALKSIPSDESKQLAIKNATTIITGNRGGSGGGGIGNNGTMQLGLKTIPKKININVSKEWKNDQGKENKRPEEITIKLLKKGVQVGNPVKLNKTNNWSFKFSDLDLSTNDVPQDYTIEEISVPGYESKSGTLTNIDELGNYKIKLTNTKETKPEIGTKASDSITNTSKGAVSANGKVTIVDEVSYENLNKNTDYILMGTLMSKDGQVFKANGEAVTGKLEFNTGADTSGTKKVIFTFDASELKDNSSFVVFEKLFEKGKLDTPIVTHEDINDENQTVTYSHKKEVAVEKEWKIPSGYEIATPEAIEIELFLDGVKTDKKLTLNQSNNWKGSFRNIAYESEVSIQEAAVHEDYDAKYITKAGIDGSVIYVAENTYKKSTDPRIKTQAVDKNTNSSKGAVGSDGIVTLVDTVNYEKLNTNKEYTLVGTLMVKDGTVNGTPLLVDGKQVTSSAVFTPARTNGSQNITFTFDASKLNDNTSLVVFEELFVDGQAKAEHKDINDEDQTVTYAHKKDVNVEKEWSIQEGHNITTPGSVEVTLVLDGVKTDKKITLNNANGWNGQFKNIPYEAEVTIVEENVPQYFKDSYTTKIAANGGMIYVAKNTLDPSSLPKIGTKAVDGTTNASKSAVGSDKQATIIDTVNYKNLNKNTDYTVIGTLMNKDGQVFKVNGKAITGKAEFNTGNTTSGNATVTFTFDASNINDNTSLVVFEKLFVKEDLDNPVAIHEDLNDKDQTVTYEHKKTVNVEKEWKIPSGYEITTPDAIEVELYLDGIKTGKKLTLNQDNNWKGSFDNIASEAEVSIQEVKVHEDYEARYTTKAGVDGSVVYVAENTYKKPTDPRIKTKASDNATKNNRGKIGLDGTVTLIDKVSYEKLNTNKEYTLVGTLMVKDGTPAGTPLLVDGKQVTSSAVFTPKSTNGTQDITFSFDAKAVTEDISLVVFEELLVDGQAKVEHKDINDKDQTVTYVKEEKPEKKATSTSAVSGSSVKVGDLITYTIKYKNCEASKARVTITDKLADGVKYESSGPNGSYDENTRTVTWNIGEIESAATGEVTVTVEVTEDALIEIENEATVKVGDNESKTNVEKVPVEPKKPEKKVVSGAGIGGSEVNIGDKMTYEITARNFETTIATITVKDKLPEGVKYLGSSEKGAYDENTHTVTWKLENIKSGAEKAVTVDVEVNDKAVVKIENDAKVIIGDHEVDSDTVTNPVKPVEPVKEATSTSAISGEGIAVGDLITYTIKYRNNEAGKAKVTITDNLADGVKYESSSPNGSYDDNTRTVIWNIGEVESAATGEVSVTVRVTEDALIEIENEATVKVGDNESKTNVEKVPVEPKKPEKEVVSGAGISEGAVKVGDKMTYRITARNFETETATITVKDKLPEGLKYLGSSDKGAYDEKTHTVTWKLENIKSGAEKAVTVDVEVNDKAVAKIENDAKVIIGDHEVDTEKTVNKVVKTVNVEKEWKIPSGHEITTPDAIEVELYLDGQETGKKLTLNQDNNWKGSFDNIASEAEVSIQEVKVHEDYEARYTTKAGVDGSVVYVAENTYKKPTDPRIKTKASDNATKNNRGKIGLDGTVTLIDKVSYEKLNTNKEYTLVGTLMIKDGTPAGTPLLVDGKQVTSSAVFTPKSTNGTQDVTFSFDAKAVTEDISLVVFEQLSLDGKVVATHKDINDKDQTVTYVKEEKPEKKATSTSAVSGSSVKVGDLITYTIKYKNSEAGKAKVTITDNLADGVKYESSSPNGSYDDNTRTVTWNIGEVESAATGEVSVTVRVTEDALIEIENEATIKVGDNESKTNVEKVPVEPKKPEKEVVSGSGISEGAVKVGDKMTYKITARNFETTTATITIKDKLPEGLKYLGSSDKGTYDEKTHTVTWKLENIKSGAEKAVTVDVEVNDKAVAKIENDAKVIIGDHEVDTEKTVNKVVKTVNVEKEWKIPSGYEITTPDAIEVELYLDGQETGKKLTLNQGNNWKGSFDNIASESEVSIKEVKVHEDYDASYTTKAGLDGGVIYVAENTYKKPTDPRIKTKASDNATKNNRGKIGLDGTVTLVDKVSYENLNTNKEYTLVGTLMIKDGTPNGAPLLVDGKQVTSSAVFTPKSINGTQDITFTFDASKLKDNTSLVVFEQLSLDGKVVATHEDINDEDQTVAYENKRDVVVEKQWANLTTEAGIVTAKSINVELYLNGSATGIKKELNDKNNWRDVFKDISNDISYDNIEIIEISKDPKFTTTYEKIDDAHGKLAKIVVTNTGNITEKEKTSVTVNKTWNIPENANVAMPEYINVKLLKDGADTGEKLILNDINGWNGIFSDLDTDAKYTVIEENIKSFKPEYKMSFENGKTTVELINHYVNPDDVLGEDSHPGDNSDKSSNDKAGKDEKVLGQHAKTFDAMNLIPLIIILLLMAFIIVFIRRRNYNKD